MLINELPDDCLLTIFDYLNNLDDLVNCFKVCIKWSHLTAQRTKKVKYLLGYPENGDCVSYRGTEPIDGTCLSTLFPNLKIAEISYKFGGKVKREDIVALLKNQKSLKGLTGRYHEALSEYCDNLEMVSFDLFNSSSQHNGSSIKQLYRWTSIDRFQKDVHYFPNLERLNVHCDYEYDLYTGPVLEKLKILELFSSYPHGICYALKFMDSCPNLQSAHILLNDNPLFVDETIRLECLQDL
uniref:F-box domain-containing protein n=1 Tax=Tetranychus urticae TaxID=32264 RepID=T1L699_TETUR